MPTLPWPWRSNPPSAPTTTTTTTLDAPTRSILLVLASAALTATSIFITNRYARRIRNSDWVTPHMFRRRRWVRGVVTSVGDADNFRLYHTPPLGYRWPLKFRRVPSDTKELKDETLHIRIAGIDAPEGAHFGRPAQPYYTESLAWLRAKIHGKSVYCQLLRRDQYGRTVATVHLPRPFLPLPRRVLALEMLRAGWATTYVQAGAEYGKIGKPEFISVEAEARAARRGMWAHGVTGESPAEYKRRHAALEAAVGVEEAEAVGRKKSGSMQGKGKVDNKKRGWVRGLLGL